MKKVITFVAGMVFFVSAIAQDNTGLAHPESINSDGQFLYVTNIGKALEPTAKDGDGSISKLSLEGKMITPSITDEKLNAPKGTAIIKGVLYVADIDRIVGIQLATGKKVAEVSLASTGTVFANDLTVKDDQTLFVSATDVGKVFEVNLKSNAVQAIADVKGANGICYDKATNRLYTCSFSFENMQGGEIGVISWQQQKPVYEKIGDAQGAFDGLALLDDHTLIVSDWGAMDHPAGFVEKIDLTSKKVTKLNWPVIAGPADFYFDTNRKRLVIPALVEEKVLIQQL
jgi:DNA-binding beta-propeller fold protein YncE